MRALVLIKHYGADKAALTRRCVDSVLPSLDPLDKLYVLDGTGDYEDDRPHVPKIHDATWPGLIGSFNDVIRSDPNLRRAWDVDAYACLNNDVEPHPDWLREIKAVLASPSVGPGMNIRVGIAAPLTDDKHAGWLYWPDGPRTDALLGGFVLRPHVDNHAWVFTEELVTKIGLPDARFPGAGWGANLDFCYRARKAGFWSAVVLRAWVHHEAGATFGVDPEYRAKAAAERDRILTEKYGDPRKVWE